MVMRAQFRRGLRLAALALAGAATVVLMVALAWLASNWRDDEPVVPPAALSLGPAQPGSPLFFKLQGLTAPPGLLPEVVGREEWQAQQAVPALAAPALAASAPLPARLATVQGPPLDCRPPDDCVRLLAAGAPAAAAQLAPLAELGERCKALLSDLRLVEPLPEVLNSSTVLPAFAGITHCGKWFRGQALAAAARGDRTATLKHLQDGQNLTQAMLVGSRWLIGMMVGGSVLRSQFDATAAVALLQPDWAPALAALLGPLPPQALDGHRWALTEAAYSRGTLTQMLDQCGSQTPVGDEGGAPALVSWLVCRTGIGLLPKATRQALDQRWLQTLAVAQQGLDAAVDQGLLELRQPTPSGWVGLRWRNTLGAALTDSVAPAWGRYFARQADVDLHRQTLALALAATAQRVPVAERAAWLERQAITPRMRSRLAWADGGAVLQARPWVAEWPGSDTRRADIRLAVPVR